MAKRNRKKIYDNASRENVSLIREAVKRYSRNVAAMIGLAFFLVVLFVIIFAEEIVPPEMVTAYDVRAKLMGPSADHIFGTDHLGRDIFARVIYGTRVTVGIGVGSTLLALIIGAALASLCALNRQADFVIMRVVDVGTSIPYLLLALLVLAVLGGSVFNMILTLTVISIPGFITRIRAILFHVVEQDYVKAARLSGTKTVSLVIHHILPNAIDPIIVDATMTISSMLLSAAGLSFIGVGVAPPSPEWGAMLNYAQAYFRTSPHTAVFPGIAIALTALSINLIGDGLRDALDPKALK